MQVRARDSSKLARSSMTISVLIVLCCSPEQCPAQCQDARVADSAVDTGPSQCLQNSEDGDGLEREKQVVLKQARKTVDEITSELAKSTRPDVILYLDRGHAYRLLHEFEKAFDDYTKVIESGETRGLVHIALEYRVYAAVGKGDYAQALKDATALTKASPPQSRAYAMCALILARSPDEKVKNPKVALEYAKRALAMAGPGRDVAIAERALAAAYSANGDFEQAVVHQEKAIAGVKGEIAPEMKAELEAYKDEKEYPFEKPAE